MLVLFETPAGYAIFKLLDEGKLKKTKNLYKHFQTPEDAARIVRLTHFERFADTTEALAATTAAVEGKVSKNLKHALKAHVNRELQEQLMVADAKLGSAIREKLNVQCVANTNVQELMRCIRSQADSLITGLPTREMTAMALGLAHSLSRYKLKFSPDKVDTMIVQAVSLLDDLDKELNNYVMRLREWYGWHFPELGKIVTDNLVFAKTVKIIGTRDHTATSDLSDILPEEIERQVKEAAEVSMGTEIADNDIFCIQNFCNQIIDITGYRANLWTYLQGRMMAIAPNLTVLVGDLVGARLISHAGSLINLAKHPASTVQILGAEKALFRALKTKKDTPKYGLIYHSQLVGQSSARLKGKASRMLAAKASLATRVDALGEDGNFTLGAEHRAKLESRLRILEENGDRRISGSARANARFERYRNVAEAGGEARQYPAAADSTLPSGSKRKRSESETVKEESTETTKRKKKKKKMQGVETAEVKVEESEESPKKKKKKVKQEKLDESAVKEETEDEAEAPTSSKKKKKKSNGTLVKEEIDEEAEIATSSKKKKKKSDGLPVKREIEEEVEIPTSSKKNKIKQEVSPVKVINEEAEQPSSSKKKKKKGKKELDESGVSSLTEVLEAETPTPSKKKKKPKQALVDLEVSVEANEETERSASEKKKKKKKKKHLETE